MSTASAAPKLDEDDERLLWRKVSWRIIPLVSVAFLVGYVDRANLGYVARPMGADLGLTTAQVGLSASLFFVGYILLEVPSNMMLHRFGARIWISRIIITWGLVTVGTAAIQSGTQLYVARLLLGLAEAGLSAGILLYLTMWFPRRKRSFALSTFHLMVPISGIVGAPIAAALLRWGQSLLGMEGWRSLFVVEGALTVMIGITILIWLPDRPSKAKWLTAAERDFLEDARAGEAELSVDRGALTGARQVLRDKKVWLLGIASLSIVFGLYPLAFFLPSMIAELTHGHGSASVLLAAIPSLVAVVVMLLWARFAARRSIIFSTVVPMAFGAAGLLMAMVSKNPVLFVIAICISLSGIYTAMPQFWRLPALSMTGAAAAAGIALINSLSNFSGLISPYMTGAIETATGSYELAFLIIVVVMCIGMCVLFTAGRRAEQIGSVEELNPAGKPLPEHTTLGSARSEH